MDRKRTLGRRIGLRMLLMLGACADSTGPAQQLDVSLSASSATVRSDQPVTITITAVNRGTGPVEVNANPCPEAYSVTAPSGEVVAPGPALCAAVAIVRVLRPGERLEHSYTWAGTTREAIDAPAVQLPAGAYHLRGAVVTRGGEVTSAAVPIQVQP